MIRRLLIDRENSDKTAIIECDKEITYLELINKASALQPLLMQEKQENIAIFLPDGSDYIAAFWGTVMSAMTAFPLNVLMTVHEILPLLKYVRVKTVITSAVYRRLFEEIAAFEMLSLKIIYMEELGAISHKDKFGATDSDSDAPMVLLNTSGTTGKCKIVQLSEKNVEASALGYLDKLRLEETKLDNIRYTLAAPFSSVYGIMILSACLMKSFSIVLLDQPFTLDSFFRTAAKHRVTHYEGSASTILLMEQIIGKLIPYDTDALTHFGFGGSKVSASTIEKLHSTYKGKEFYQGYGMTEASPLITKHPREKIEKTDSVGTAIKGVEIAVETDEGISRVPYSEGEIVVRGPNVMLGYYDNEAETKRVLKNGYLYTGDIGYLDEDGYLYICGRKKNMIIIRGFKVYSEEIEECIQNSLLAKDCYVYGRIDGYGNEMVCADIVPIHSQIHAEEVKKYCGSHLAEYKQPKQITFCESIKKTASGKTERLKGVSLWT